MAECTMRVREIGAALPVAGRSRSRAPSTATLSRGSLAAGANLKGAKGASISRSAKQSHKSRRFALSPRADVGAVAEPEAPASPAPTVLSTVPETIAIVPPAPVPAPTSPLPEEAVESSAVEGEVLDSAAFSNGASLAAPSAEPSLEASVEVEVSAPSTNGAALAAPEEASPSVPEEASLAIPEEASLAIPEEASPEAPEAAAEEPGFYEPAVELLAAAQIVPHPDKVEKGGEDAYLISDVGAGVICVADGVGGWASDGVDPALYSKELVFHLQQAVEEAECQEDLEPQQLLRRAHTLTRAEGAATAVVAVFDGEQSTLEVANVGDSGVLVVRKGEVIFKSESQQHYFDCPYQLGSESSDSPDDAQLHAVELLEGDTVVMGSDGLFDNVFDKDIACVVKVFGGQDSTAVQRSATALAALASKHAADPEYMSPYILEAIQQGKDLPVWEKMLGRKLSGGKLDDITVVVAQVVKAA